MPEWITSREMRRIELNSRWLGFEEEYMMENAGAGVARVVLEEYSPGEVLVVCGTGGNGGDGFVAARHLNAEGVDVDVLLLGRREAIRNPAAERNLERLESAGIGVREVRDSSELEDLDFEREVIVDAILGFGIRGRLREPVRTAVVRINEASRAGSRVVSVDVPTGMDPDTGEVPDVAVEADVIVSIHRHKRGVRRARDAFLRRVNAGIPELAERICGPGDLITSGARERDPWAYKGKHGRILIVAGSDRYVGAPRLTAQGALRAGADLVFLLTPSEVPRDDPNLIYLGSERVPGPEDLEEAPLEDVDAVVVGPGLGPEADAEGLIERLSDEFDGTVVVDADGLRGVRRDLVDERFVLTPHAGEFRRVFGESPGDGVEEREETVGRVAEDWGCTVLLKGPVDVIGSPEGEVRLNVTGTPGMTVGGTGDVLAGVVGALAAVCEDAFEAARVGAFVVGAAGQLAEEERSQCLTAMDVVERVPDVFRDPWSVEPSGVRLLRQ